MSTRRVSFIWVHKIRAIVVLPLPRLPMRRVRVIFVSGEGNIFGDCLGGREGSYESLIPASLRYYQKEGKVFLTASLSSIINLTSASLISLFILRYVHKIAKDIANR